MAKRLTQAAIERMKPDPAKNYAVEIPDAGKPGLYLVIQPSGKKSFALRYRRPSDGKPRKLTLGFPSLATAHKLAQDALNAIAEGGDPAAAKQEEKREAKAGVPDRDLFRNVVDRYLKANTSLRNYREKARLLGIRDDAVIPGRAVSLWGHRRIQDITRRDVWEHLEELAVTAPIGANRAFSEFRKFFNWTVEEDILPLSPIAGKKKLTSEEGRERNRTLLRTDDVPGSTDDELRWLWKAAASYDRGEPSDLLNGKKLRGPFGPLTQLLILTGQRRSEVAGMTWGELDLVERTWTIPGSRTKNKQAHMVPLSDAAMEIIESLDRIAGKAGYVFTTNGRTAVSGYDRMKKRLDRLMAEVAEEERGEAVTIPRWTLHDIRRTVAAGLQRLGIKLEVTEKALNHTSGSFAGIVKVYQVYGYAEEKRAALQAWGRFVTDLVEGRAANVVPLRA